MAEWPAHASYAVTKHLTWALRIVACHCCFCLCSAPFTPRSRWGYCTQSPAFLHTGYGFTSCLRDSALAGLGFGQ